MATADAAKTTTVADIMSRPVVTATPGETVAQAAARMGEGRVGSVVVVEGGRPVGILTERDLVRIGAAVVDTGTVTVREWMTPNPNRVAPDAEAPAAFASLSEHGYRHIPVVDGDVLVGIVSMRDLMRIAQIQPAEHLAHDLPRGLEGVVVAQTDIGDVRGLEGFYHYRQYDAVELAEKRTLEDVWYLLFEGTLPSLAQRAEFAAAVAPLRHLPEPVADALPELARVAPGAPPLDMLRTSISLVGAHLGFRPSLDVKTAELRAQALRVCAIVPTLLTTLHRLQHGLEAVTPRDDLTYAANYLYMMTGEVPPPDHALAIEQYLISTIDHGFNASTFTARVITSTGADLAAAVVGAIGALSGPLHGGAPSRALDMLDAIGTIDNAEAWLRDAVIRGDRLMGFGHRVYKTDDPRSVMLRGVAERLGGEQLALAKQIEAKAIEVLAELKPGRKLYTNVEFYAGIVMDRCGLPREMFTPTFASSRVIGWCAHVLEQATDNRLIRPSAQYVGPPPPQPVPDPA
ncbi:MAG: citrate synthase [Actinobacteria bacterium]|nr:citrate synthase [Actinomycetota bacterium]